MGPKKRASCDPCHWGPRPAGGADTEQEGSSRWQQTGQVAVPPTLGLATTKALNPGVHPIPPGRLARNTLPTAGQLEPVLTRNTCLGRKWAPGPSLTVAAGVSPPHHMDLDLAGRGGICQAKDKARKQHHSRPALMHGPFSKGTYSGLSVPLGDTGHLRHLCPLLILRFT